MEVKESRTALKKRWYSDTGGELARAVQVRIRNNEELDGLGIREVDGRLDLRYIPFSADFSVVQGARLQGLDLTGAMAANLRLIDTEIRGCRLDEADCQFWRLRGCVVSDSSFARANIRHSTLGEWHEGRGNTYRGVNFASARLKHSTTSAAVYEECDFSFAELDRVNFWQSSLIRCRFAGPLRDVVFDGRLLGEGKPEANPFLDIDLSGAQLQGCEFRGLSFDSVRLPPDAQLIVVRDRETLERAMARLSSMDLGPGGEIVEMLLEHADGLLAMGGEALLNLGDLENEDEATQVSDLLHQAGLTSPR